MKLLLIATGYLPYAFSENICNGKLVLALRRAGYHVDVISRKDEGPAYSSSWEEPWTELQPDTHEISYQISGKVAQCWDTLEACLQLRIFPVGGIRWAKRALRAAFELHRQRHYDAVLTRSPSDIPHIVGREFCRKTGVKWLANWNDPVATIWPGAYAQSFSRLKAYMYNQIYASCVSSASVNTFPSHQLMEHFKRHFPVLSTVRCEVIPHVQLPSDIYPKHEYTRKGEFRMCHAGNMSGERDPELLFAAMKDVMTHSGQSIHLDILGVPNPRLSELMVMYGLQNHIHFLPPCAYMESLQIMQRYDALVLLEAKLEEGIFMASKNSDYAQSGRPILAVSPQKGYAAEFFAQFGGGIAVNNEDSASIASGLTELLLAWNEGTLDDRYTSEKLNAQLSSEVVQKIYQRLLSA